MNTGTEIENLSQVVLDSLEEEASADQLARRAHRSRAQFFRVFGAMIDTLNQSRVARGRSPRSR
jgi:hypothetical protein